MPRVTMIPKQYPNHEEEIGSPYDDPATGGPIRSSREKVVERTPEEDEAYTTRMNAEYVARQRAKAAAAAGTHHPTEGPVTGFKHERR